jgi:hypothetical protein
MLKRQIPLLITFIMGVFFIVKFYVPALDDLGDIAQNWSVIISSFAMLIAIGNVLIVHSMKVMKKRDGWIYSLVLILSFFFMAIIGFVDGGEMEKPTNFSFLYSYVYNPLQATMFSMLAFYVASAAFRAFRIKSFEATLLLLSGFFVMIGNVPIGKYMWSEFPVIQSWIMNYCAAAGMRAIMIGVALGAVSMSLKIIFGLERSYLGGGE